MKANKREMISHLMEAIMTLQNLSECEQFFNNLCTSDEIEKFSKRLLIAKLINDGENYRSILKKTNTSNATVSRIKNVMTKDKSVLADVVKRIK